MTVQAKRLIIVGGTVVFVGIIALLIWNAINNMSFQPHGYLSIQSIPDSLTMTYGNTNKTITTNSTSLIPVATGKYTFSFTSTGFSTYSVELTIENGKTSSLAFKLAAQTADAAKEASKDKYRSISEAIAGYTISTEGTTIADKYPITKVLPIDTLTYSLDTCEPYGTSDGSVARIGVCITVTDINDPSQVSAAITELTSRSFNPDNFVITINNLHYPSSSERSTGYCTLQAGGVCQDR